MRRSTPAFCSFAGFALALACAAPAGAGEPRTHLVVLHTNDVHGQTLPRERKGVRAGGLARLAAAVNAVRAEAARDGSTVFVVDAGDWYQGTPEGVVDDGLSFVTALASVGYDAMCVGNHEFDHGIPSLQRILKEARVPGVCANLLEPESAKRVAWVEPWRELERGGVRVAFTGLCTVHTPEMTHPDARSIRFEDATAALTRVREELRGKVDLVVPVTHLGIKEDRELAKRFPDLPLIVGGHSHTRLAEGERQGSTLIVQTGTKAETLGRVDLWLDPSTKRVVESRAALIELLEEPKPELRNATVERLATELAAKSAERMQVVVGELAQPLVRAKDPLASSTLGNFVADVLREHARADVGVMNRGGIRTDLEAGSVTRRAVFECVPFENNVSVLKLTGEELFTFLARAVEGKAHSGVEMSGCKATVDVDSAGTRKLAALEVGGKPLEKGRVYRVAMNSFMADGGDLYLETRVEGDRRTDDALLVRDVVEQAFVARKRIEPPADDRYVVRRTP